MVLSFDDNKIFFSEKRHKTKTIKIYTRQKALLRIERELFCYGQPLSQSPYVSCSSTFEKSLG